MKRIGLLICILFLTLWSRPAPVFAQEKPNYIDNGYPADIEAGINDNALNTGSFVSATNTNSYSDIIRRVLGPVPGLTTKDTNPQSSYNRKMFQQSAAYGLSAYTIALFTNPPASSIAFFNDMGQSLGFIRKPAYAQGIGFSGLTLILPIWKAFRNVSYALLAIAMVIVGFMVMFRKKIDPKTVVTVQNALPRIVLTLILITFSYAIAGLMIDLMYVCIALIVTILIPAGNSVIPNNNPFSPQLNTGLVSQYINGNFGTFVGQLFAGGFQSVNDIAAFLGYSPVNLLAGGLVAAAFAQPAVGAAIAFGPIVLIGLIVAVLVLFGILRVFFMLLSAYIQIIISILAAPLLLLAEAFPGSKSFGNWLLNLTLDLLVFPITAAILIIGTILTQSQNSFFASSTNRLWTPPFLSSDGYSGIVGLIGLGLLLSIPSVVTKVKESLKAKQALPIGAGGLLGFASQGGQMLISHWIQSRMLAQNIERRESEKDRQNNPNVKQNISGGGKQA